MMLKWEVQHLESQNKLKCKVINVLRYLLSCTLQKFGNNLLMTFILLLRLNTWKTFSITSTIFMKVFSLLWRKKTMENFPFFTIYWNEKISGKISVMVYRKPTYTDQYYTTALTTKLVTRKGLLPLSWRIFYYHKYRCLI